MTARITYAGCHESTLASAGEPIGRTVYETPEAAVRALRDLVANEDAVVTVRVGDAIHVYRDQEDADAGEYGGDALGVVEVAS